MREVPPIVSNTRSSCFLDEMPTMESANVGPLFSFFLLLSMLSYRLLPSTGCLGRLLLLLLYGTL